MEIKLHDFGEIIYFQKISDEEYIYDTLKHGKITITGCFVNNLPTEGSVCFDNCTYWKGYFKDGWFIKGKKKVYYPLTINCQSEPVTENCNSVTENCNKNIEQGQFKKGKLHKGLRIYNMLESKLVFLEQGKFINDQLVFGIKKCQSLNITEEGQFENNSLVLGKRVINITETENEQLERNFKDYIKKRDYNEEPEKYCFEECGRFDINGLVEPNAVCDFKPVYYFDNYSFNIVSFYGSRKPVKTGANVLFEKENGKYIGFVLNEKESVLYSGYFKKQNEEYIITKGLSVSVSKK